MPRTVISVGRVDSVPTSKPGVTSHTVTATHLVHGCGFQVHTINDFAAALCDRAKQQRRQVAVLWKDGRFGKQLVDVDLLETPAEERGAVA